MVEGTIRSFRSVLQVKNMHFLQFSFNKTLRPFTIIPQKSQLNVYRLYEYKIEKSNKIGIILIRIIMITIFSFENSPKICNQIHLITDI